MFAITCSLGDVAFGKCMQLRSEMLAKVTPTIPCLEASLGPERREICDPGSRADGQGRHREAK